MAVSEMIRRPYVHEEGDEDNGHDDAGLDEDALHVADRGLDEGRLPELDVLRVHAGRQGLLDGIEGRLDLSRQLDGVGPWLLLDRHDDGRASVEAGVSALHGRGEVDPGDLAQEHGLALAVGYHRVAQIVEALGQADVSDEVLAAMLVDEAAAGVGAEARDRGLDLLGRDVEVLHRGRVRRDPVLAHLAADGDDLRDPGDAENLRADGEIGELAHLHGRHGVRRDGHEQDLAHDRGHGPHVRTDPARQALAYDGELFGNELPTAIDVRRPVELDVDDGQAGAGNRAHAGDARHAVHGGLDRVGHDLLDLLGGKTLGLGHDGDHRPVEVGQHVDGKSGQHEAAVGHQDDGRGEDEEGDCAGWRGRSFRT